MPKCALPPHLQDRLHNDWIWPLSRVSRGFNAKGPRCGEGSPGYLPWPPKLVEGFDCTRWEWADLKGNHKEVYIPSFAGKEINASVYGLLWETENGDLIDFKDGWWPSIIQYKSEAGYLKLNPSFQCAWRTKPDWRRYYWRWGWRPDFDLYYNWGPFAGRNFE